MARAENKLLFVNSNFWHKKFFLLIKKLVEILRS